MATDDEAKTKARSSKASRALIDPHPPAADWALRGVLVDEGEDDGSADTDDDSSQAPDDDEREAPVLSQKPGVLLAELAKYVEPRKEHALEYTQSLLRLRKRLELLAPVEIRASDDDLIHACRVALWLEKLLLDADEMPGARKLLATFATIVERGATVDRRLLADLGKTAQGGLVAELRRDALAYVDRAVEQWGLPKRDERKIAIWLRANLTTYDGKFFRLTHAQINVALSLSGRRKARRPVGVYRVAAELACACGALGDNDVNKSRKAFLEALPPGSLRHGATTKKTSELPPGRIWQARKARAREASGSR